MISKNSLKYHLYVDNTQLYLHTFLQLLQILFYLLKGSYYLFHSYTLMDELQKIASQSTKNWISCYWTLNNKASSFLILLIYLSAMISSQSACNLGSIFDYDISFSDQINSISKSCHFHIWNNRRICHLLPLFAATRDNSLISSIRLCLSEVRT